MTDRADFFKDLTVAEFVGLDSSGRELCRYRHDPDSEAVNDAETLAAEMPDVAVVVRETRRYRLVETHVERIADVRAPD